MNRDNHNLGLDALVANPELVTSLDAEARAQVIARCAAVVLSVTTAPIPDLPVVHHKDELLTATEAAKLLGLSPKSVLKAARAGELPARKVGSRYRFSRAALLGIKPVGVS